MTYTPFCPCLIGLPHTRSGSPSDEQHPSPCHAAGCLGTPSPVCVCTLCEAVSRIEFGSIDPNGRLFMCDSMHETAATPSVSLAAVEFVSLAAAAMCGCVFSKTMYLDSQRYTVFWPYTVCRPNTKTKISRTSTQTHTQTVSFFFLACSN